MVLTFLGAADHERLERLVVEFVLDLILLAVFFVVVFAGPASANVVTVTRERSKQLVDLRQRPLCRLAFVQHARKLVRERFDSPQDRVTSIAQAVQSRIVFVGKVSEDGSRFGFDVALDLDEFDGLR
jgi:hypothetical protein